MCTGHNHYDLIVWRWTWGKQHGTMYNRHKQERNCLPIFGAVPPMKHAPQAVRPTPMVLATPFLWAAGIAVGPVAKDSGSKVRPKVAACPGDGGEPMGEPPNGSNISRRGYCR